jgi:hypothetical protein
MTEYRTETRASLLDLLDFISEQMKCARHPSDRAAAVDAARGAVPYLKDRLRGTDYDAQFKLLFGDLMFVGQWSENWIAKDSDAEFATFADDLEERLRSAKDVLGQPAAEQMKDDDDRTNSMGLFNLAEAYRLSAIRLQESPVKIGHAESPLRFLYYHALELYLKALLRHEHSVQTLSSNEFGHKIQRLVKEAERLFLKIEDEDREVFSLVADTDTVIEARYIRTGSKSLPALEGLKRTSENVRNHVGARLRELGVMVRL